MVWMRSWNLLQKTSLQGIILKNKNKNTNTNTKTPSFPYATLHNFLQFSSLSNQSPGCCSRAILLTPKIVQSTLLNCPSDLISLTFFLWCARQKDYFHSRGAFAHMVDVVARLTDRFGSVDEILEQLKALGFVTRPQILLLLLRIYWHGGMYHLVFQTFEEMFKRGYKPNTYARNIVMDVMFKIGRVSVALRVLKETRVPNFLTFTIAICNLCKLSDLVNVRDVLRSMFRNGYYLNAETFSVVLSCFCKMGKLPQALQLFGLMTTLGIPINVNTWSILIDGHSKSGKLVMAGYLLEKMVEAGCSPTVVTYTSLIKGFMESKVPSGALSLLRTMESKGHSFDLVLCNVLIDCFSKLGRYDDALDLFVSFPGRKLVPDSFTFCSIMSVVCLSQQFAFLPTLVQGLPVEADLVACNSILSYFCKAGYPSGAVEFYKDMIDRGLLPDRYSYAGLLCGLCGAGRTEEAVNVYRGILRNHLGLDAHIHTVIIHGLIKSGNSHRAIRLFREAAAKKYPLDVVSYTVAINGLFRARRPEEAYNLYKQMKDGGIAPNTKTYNSMISGFCKERDVEKVKEIIQEMIDTGTELGRSTSNRIKNLLFRSHKSDSILNLIIELRDRVKTKEINGNEHDIANFYLPPIKDDMVDSLYVRGTSSSGDFTDVAAAVG